MPGANWRERLGMGPKEAQEFSDESMAVNRIMKALGTNRKNIGNLCRQFNIPYNEDDTSFKRAVSIFKAVSPKAELVEVFDVKSGRNPDDVIEYLLDDNRTAIVFFRLIGFSEMTAYVRGRNFLTSTLGALVIRPGIRFLRERDDVQLWQQDVNVLLKSFLTREAGVINGD